VRRRSVDSVSKNTPIEQIHRTYDLLVDSAVLLGVLAHGATVLLLSGVEALVEVVLLACGLVGVVVVGVHDESL
jgi:hypothetical protein